MSIPRRTDVAQHLARKPRPAAILHSETILLKDVPRSDLQVLSKDLADAVDSAHGSSLSGVIQ